MITSLQVGGAEHIVVQLAQGLLGLGHVVDIAVFNGEETVFTEEAEAARCKIYRLGGGVYNPAHILKLSGLMWGYDIVHTHNSSPQLFVALASVLCSVVAGKGHRPLLATTEHTTSNRKRGWKWYAPVESWMYGRYDHSICISGIAEQKLREYMGGGWLDVRSAKYQAISTVNNGVDVDGIRNAVPNRELAYGKQGRWAILMVAGFREAKDQDTIVRAMSRLPKDRFEVWFAGDGVRREEVQRLAQELDVAGNVKFLGLRADIPNVLRAADVIVMSSHWEGLSLSNVEGMSAGRPFIASDVNGLREVTKGYGLLFGEGDDGQLADLIMGLYGNADYYKEVAGKCHERAKMFDLSKMVGGYLQVYEQLMRERGGTK